MGTSSILSFDNRTRRFLKQREKLARGYRVVVRPDGLIVYRPKTSISRFLTPIAYLLFGVFAFKVFLFVYLSPLTYQSRVSILEEGTVVERAGAWVMQADALTVFLSDFVKFGFGAIGL